jgi:excinuclease UvrABC ATPase subunit
MADQTKYLFCMERFTLQKQTRTQLSTKTKIFNRSIVLVHGVSGSGKKVLVEQSLRQLTTNLHAFFVAGKY